MFVCLREFNIICYLFNVNASARTNVMSACVACGGGCFVIGFSARYTIIDTINMRCDIVAPNGQLIGAMYSLANYVVVGA